MPREENTLKNNMFWKMYQNINATVFFLVLT